MHFARSRLQGDAEGPGHLAELARLGPLHRGPQRRNSRSEIPMNAPEAPSGRRVRDGGRPPWSDERTGVSPLRDGSIPR